MTRRGERYALHAIGEMFGCPVEEVEQRLTGRALVRWIAYWKVKSDREREAIEKAKNKR